MTGNITLHGFLRNANGELQSRFYKTTNIDPNYTFSSEINQQPFPEYPQDRAILQHKVEFLAYIIHITNHKT